MLFRACIFIAALVPAIKVCQIKINRPRKSNTSSNKHGKFSFRDEEIHKENDKFELSNVEPREKKKGQIKTCKSESVDEYSNMSEFFVENKKGKNVSEIYLLKNIVREKERMQESLEVRLLELYCLKEQQSRIALLQKQLNGRTSEIDMLRGVINRLQVEKKELYEEVKRNQLAEQQLKSAKSKILELQAKKEFDAGRMKGQLMMLNERISRFRMEEEFKVPNKGDKKLKGDIEVLGLQAMEMKRRTINIQLEKRELVAKLNAAQSKIAEHSKMTEHKLVAKYQAELNRLKHVNKNLTKQVDKLHENRVSILEELVYQCWLNTCLRLELEDYHSPSPKKIKPTVCRKLNYRSDNKFCKMSSAEIESDQVTNTTNTTSSSSENNKKKKHGLVHNFKRWGRSKDSSRANESQGRSTQKKTGLIRRVSTSSIPSIISALRSRGDSALLLLLQKEASGSNLPKMTATRVRRVSFNDSINSVRYINDDSPESPQSISDNDQESTECFNDRLDAKTSCGSGANAILEGKKSEMRSSKIKFQRHEDSSELSNQDSTPTEIVHMKEIVQGGYLSSEMPNEDSRGSKFGEVLNLIVAFFFVFFLMLLYCRLLFVPRPSRTPLSLTPFSNLFNGKFWNTKVTSLNTNLHSH